MKKYILPVAILAIVAIGCGSSTEPTVTKEAKGFELDGDCLATKDK